MPGPVLFCYDGSEGSRLALRHAAEVLTDPQDAVVLTVWEPAALLLARGGAFGAMALPEDGRVDVDQRAAAQAAAEEGAAAARERGWTVHTRVEEASEGASRRILEVADELDAGLIVCGHRGRGAIRSALLGSVAHALVTHGGHLVLVAPEEHAPEAQLAHAA